MTKDELNKAVIKFGADTVSSIATALKRVGADNSGKLINSLRTELKTTAESLDMLIKGAGYFDNIEKGRLPGEQPPLSAIIEWTRSKGLPDAAAFPIAKNIGKFGIKPRPVLKEIINSNKFKEGKKLLGHAYAKDVVKEINNIIKETNIK